MDIVDCPQAISKANFLPFADVARRVGDWKFQKSSFGSTRQRRNFDFNSETLAAERELLENRRSKGFVASLDVGQFPSRKAIADRCDRSISPVMPEWPTPPSRTSQYPTAVNDVHLAV